MKIIMGSHLTNAAKLSNDWGPPLFQHLMPTKQDTYTILKRALSLQNLGYWVQ